MRQKHWILWTCSLGCSASFQTSDGLRSHVLQVHMAEVSMDNIDTLVSLSSKLDLTRAEGKCPLCLSCDIKSSRLYMSHIGYHLEQLALFVLPRNHDYAEQETSMEDDSNSEQGVQVSEAGSEALPEPELEGLGRKRGLEEHEMATIDPAKFGDVADYSTPEIWPSTNKAIEQAAPPIIPQPDQTQSEGLNMDALVST